jgi:type I restriction enzyme M protein
LSGSTLRRLIETDKKGKEKDKDWTCDPISKSIGVARYYAEEQTIIDQAAARASLPNPTR